MTVISETKRNQAWQSGKKAALAGRPRSSCRWQRGTIYFDDWCDAFDETERAKVKEDGRG